MVGDIRIEAQRARPCGNQFRAGLAVARGEKRHIVPEFHQSLGQISDYTLGSTVQFRRYRLDQRRNLRNSH